MYVNRDFSEAEPGDIEPFGFDYRLNLNDQEAIISARFEIEPVGGAKDAAASGHLHDGPSINGTIVTQNVGGLKSGVRYLIRCYAITNQNRTIGLSSFVSCK